MVEVHLRKAHIIRGVPLALSAAVLSLSCLLSPALAQTAEYQAALPDAPSVTTTRSNVAVAPSATVRDSLRFGERAHIYAHALFGPETIIGPAFGAGIGQWEDEPPGWAEGGRGYADRFGSGVARRAISETIRFGFAAVDGEDPRYLPSENRGIWARTQHAIVSSFVSRTSGGRTIPAFSRFAGVYSAAFISNVWYPDNRASAGQAARRGTTALAGTIGIHLLREFLPFHKEIK